MLLWLALTSHVGRGVIGIGVSEPKFAAEASRALAGLDRTRQNRPSMGRVGGQDTTSLLGVKLGLNCLNWRAEDTLSGLCGEPLAGRGRAPCHLHRLRIA